MKIVKLAGLLAATAFTMLATSAHAQATRTWVSGVGDDANPCSRTAPCKTFAGAISKTATNGEINCLDPGGFGGVTITKGMTIVCDYTEGGVLSAGAGVNGIIVNLPSANDTVFLSGLDLHGAGNAQNGIRIVSGGVVHIENSSIRNYRASNGLGMSVQPAGALKLTVRNTTIADNGNVGGGGILVQPTGAGGSAKVYLDHVSLFNNINNALSLNTTGNTSAAGISASIQDSSFVGSVFGIQVKTAVGTAPAVAMLTNSEVFDNGGVGIQADGASARARVRLSSITGNSTGVQSLNGGSVTSFGNNALEFNGSDGTFTPPTVPEE